MLMDDRGIPVVLPGGSGSAVAVAAGLCAASIGTETRARCSTPPARMASYAPSPTMSAYRSIGQSLKFDLLGDVYRQISAVLILCGTDPRSPFLDRAWRAPCPRSSHLLNGT